MLNKITLKNKKNLVPVVFCLIISIILIFIPTGFENAGSSSYDGSERVSAKVDAVDNSTIKDTGLVKSGEQLCSITILQGKAKGKTAGAVNILAGSLEQDKIYNEGDLALVMVSFSGNEIASVSMIDHYRIHYEIILLLMFFALLIIFGGAVGLRAILSFGATILIIWKILVPACLKGFNPLLVGFGVTALMTVIILSLVFGMDKRCLAACTGAIGGLLITCVLGIICTNAFEIQGAVMSYSESLLYSGYAHLNLTQIFMASIFLGASGAMMDLCTDITAALAEIVEKRPDLSSAELIKSGMRVGRAAMGTMTTTLLLAYSGGFIALLMVFMAQGTPLINILNYKYVAAELIHTLVGSFGLVAVAPLTAVFGGLILCKKAN